MDFEQVFECWADAVHTLEVVRELQARARSAAVNLLAEGHALSATKAGEIAVSLDAAIVAANDAEEWWRDKAKRAAGAQCRKVTGQSA
jgi:hypothetical protein